jgi:hypothetical protein
MQAVSGISLGSHASMAISRSAWCLAGAAVNVSGLGVHGMTDLITQSETGSIGPHRLFSSPSIARNGVRKSWKSLQADRAQITARCAGNTIRGGSSLTIVTTRTNFEDGSVIPATSSLDWLETRRNYCANWRITWRFQMAKLKAAARNKLSASEFGLPGSRKYPMPDRNHAMVAKSRASQMVKKGKLSASSAAKIRAKANRILG